MRKIVFCIGLLISLCIGRLSAQTVKPDPFLKTDRIVEYDYATKLFQNILPFDDPFTLKIKNLPVNVDSLTISFYEIRGNYNLFKNGKDTITEAQFIALKKIKKYEVNGWARIAGNDSTFAYIPIPFSLKPNAKYVFTVAETRITNLTNSEKEEIKELIRTNDVLGGFVDNIARTYIASNKSFRNVRSEAGTFNNLVQSELKKHDPSLKYVQTAADLDTLETGLAEFFRSIKSYYRELESLEKSIPDSNVTSKARVTAVKRVISESASWWDIANDTSLAGRIRSALDGFKDSLALPSLKAKVDDAKEALNDVTTQLAAVTNDLLDNTILVNVYRSTGLGQTYLVNMVDQANFYIGLDVGYAYIGNFSRFAGYSGLNIYFRPVNKNIPLSKYKNWLDILATRASLLVGITIESIEKINVRKGIVGTKGIILGAGVRLNSWFRINGGGLLYYRYDNNPIMNSDRYSTKVSPFISASIDIDVQQLIGGLGTSIFKTAQ